MIEQARMKRIAPWLLLILSFSLEAAQPKGGGQDEVVATLKKAQGMLRQLSQEKSELEAKLQAAEKELGEKRTQLESRSKEAAALQGELSAKVPVLNTLQSHNERYRSQLSQVTAQLQKTQADNQLLVRMVEERSQWISKCEAKNHGLHALITQVLAEYQEPDFLEQVKTLEPLTGLQGVEMENKAVEYQYKLSDLKVTKWVEPAAAESGAEPARP